MQDKHWFRFNQSEKKGLIVFAGLIVALIIFNLFADKIIKVDRRIDQQKLQAWLVSISKDSTGTFQPKPESRPAYDEDESSVRFYFNPNIITADSLKLLGFKSFQINNWVKYRDAGGVFVTMSDIYKIYGIDSNLVAELAPYIRIEIDKGSENGFSNKTRIVENEAIQYEINSADTITLKSIKGIGEIRAATILKYRDLLGGYVSEEQFSEIYGLNDSLVISMQEKFWVDSNTIQTIDVNSADFKQLIRHPYLNKYQVNSILEYREIKGKVKSVDELFNQYYLDLELNPLLKHYLSVE